MLDGSTMSQVLKCAPTYMGVGNPKLACNQHLEFSPACIFKRDKSPRANELFQYYSVYHLPGVEVDGVDIGGELTEERISDRIRSNS